MSHELDREDDSELPTMKGIRKKLAVSIKESAAVHPLRIEAIDPKKAIGIIECLVMTGSIRQAMRDFNVDRRAVHRISVDHRNVIADWREHAAGESFMLKQRTQALMHRKLDMMEDDEEQVKKTNIRDIAQAANMMGESYMNAMGAGPKAGITVNVGPTMEDVQKHFAELRARIAEKKMKNVTETPIDLC